MILEATGGQAFAQQPGGAGAVRAPGGLRRLLARAGGDPPRAADEAQPRGDRLLARPLPGPPRPDGRAAGRAVRPRGRRAPGAGGGRDLRPVGRQPPARGPTRAAHPREAPGRPDVGSRSSASRACRVWIATDPSPTAEATRSGRAVADVAGREDPRHACLQQERPALQRPAVLVAQVGPVRTKPRESVATSGGSQSVCGLAPIMRKSPSALTSLGRPLPRSRSTRWSSQPVAATADDLGAQPHVARWVSPRPGGRGSGTSRRPANRLRTTSVTRSA